MENIFLTDKMTLFLEEGEREGVRIDVNVFVLGT